MGPGLGLGLGLGLGVGVGLERTPAMPIMASRPFLSSESSEAWGRGGLWA